MFEKYSDVVGVSELCEMLNIGKNTAYRLINDNEVQSIRIGRIIKITKNSIIEFCLSDGSFIKRELCDNIAL